MAADIAAFAGLYKGEVVHKRVRPVEHKLKYRVFSMALDLDHVEEVAKASRLFSLNRFNLFSLFERDHGHRDGSALADFAWGEVRKTGMEDRVERITMLFYPRIFGLAFNPLTVYFCLDKTGVPVLVIYEVRNTFGEDLTYVVPAGQNKGTGGKPVFSHGIDKQFYVSPFNDVEGAYTFHVTPPDDALTVGVALHTDEGPLLRTHFKGQRHGWSDRALLRTFLSYPLMTLKIVSGIHWEALKLWRKGLRLKTRPPAPPNRIVYR